MNRATARLFAALEIPPEARIVLEQWCEEQLGVLAGLREVKPEAMHATLCFLGSRPLAEIDEIASACRRLAAKPPAHLFPGEVLWLPSRRPSVVAIKLEDRGGRLSELQAALSQTLSGGGWYTPEARPYLGHVTVARVAHRAKVRAVSLPAPPALEFSAGELTLFRSHPGGAGGRYERLATVTLAEP